MTSRKPSLDYTAAMRRLAEDVVKRVPELDHIQLEAVGFTISHARIESHGQYAKIIPLRFLDGSDIRIYKKRRYRMPAVMVDGKEILYIISFCMPKFQNMSFNDQLLTLIHELYHISPAFNGDIRRFPGRNYAHGSSRKAYNARVKELVDGYLAAEPDPEALAVLTPNMEELLKTYGRVTARRIPAPKLIPLDPIRKRRAA